jgi:RND family efflux transporter MFP subunit
MTFEFTYDNLLSTSPVPKPIHTTMMNEDLSKLRISRPSVAAGHTRKRGRRAIVAAAAAVAIGGGWYALNAGSPTRVDTVTAGYVYPSQDVTLLNATGYVVAQRKAAVSSKATGRLEWLGVLEGSHVKQGEIIARLESQDVAAIREQAQANVRVAKANLAQGQAELHDAQRELWRSSELRKRGFISGSTQDAAIARHAKATAGIASLRAAVAAAEAGRKGAEVGVEQTEIRAPFDGVVLTKSANLGDIVTPFSSALDAKGAVVTLADMDTLEVEADVSESSLSKVSVGQPCEIQLDAFPDTRFAGSVSRMVPTVDRTKATLLVKVGLVDHDPRILPDMSAKVAFLSRALEPGERKPVIATRPAAVVRRGGQDVAWVINNDRVEQRKVTVRGKIGDLVEVRGVAVGDKLVLNPPEALRDGMAVRPAQK